MRKSTCLLIYGYTSIINKHGKCNENYKLGDIIIMDYRDGFGCLFLYVVIYIPYAGP